MSLLFQSSISFFSFWVSIPTGFYSFSILLSRFQSDTFFWLLFLDFLFPFTCFCCFALGCISSPSFFLRNEVKVILRPILSFTEPQRLQIVSFLHDLFSRIYNYLSHCLHCLNVQCNSFLFFPAVCQFPVFSEFFPVVYNPIAFFGYCIFFFSFVSLPCSCPLHPYFRFYILIYILFYFYQNFALFPGFPCIFCPRQIFVNNHFLLFLVFVAC